MIQRIEISEDQAKNAIELGEFEDTILASGDRVAIILTQDWCPQWLSMRRWIRKNEKSDKPGAGKEPDVIVYELIYNGKPFGNEFMKFKEDVLGNDLVPYVRYYRKGRLVGESNFVSRGKFFSYFGE